jgi:uncharacterized protein YecE (DUF72 family)
MAPDYYIGTSGWHYAHWRGIFYPAVLSPDKWLKYFSQYFNTVEINYSFYRLPLESIFSTWCESVPDGFCFAVKASRFITHVKRLNASQETINFINRANYLHNHLGPLLYQLPPGFHRDDVRLETFLDLLSTLNNNLKHVFEFRHSSWMNKAIFDLLRKYNAGFCIFDMPGFVSPVEATTDFAYVRLHGKGELYSGSYPDSELSNWAARLKALGHGLKSVYIYFNNDAGAHAIRNALTLRSYMQDR